MGLESGAEAAVGGEPWRGGGGSLAAGIELVYPLES